MGGVKGCGLFASGGVFFFIFCLLMLFMMAGGGDSASAGGLGLATNSVPTAYLRWVQAAGAECKAVSAPLIAAQIQQESGWNPNAVSPVGAEGIAQFMPETWPNWGKDDDGTHNVSPFNAADAIMAMGRYDCAIAKEVANVPGDPIANMLAGYNAGSGAVVRYNGVPPYAETQGYVTSIEALMKKFEAPLAPGGGGGTAFGQAEIAAAEKYIGLPYVWGGGAPSGPTGGGFDCSGLVLYAVYQASGGKIELPHSSEEMATMGTEVPRNQMQPGDAIVIQTEGPGDYSHVVLYIGGGQIVEAPHTGAFVRTAPLSQYDGMVQDVRRFG
ncbi:NlpC/P60 family protein [Streptantibioticus rubrisoli]|uniref:NlpC/P60 family protein n=1 Tax=Streptantibioticus rubrisoli TaxID=1387313 RepID=A0ABT1PFY1_9ACTN|nr:NlpC/P60 family protein [Streptantibioticus rubrisoli]MCQ4044275.1 NlpC/P60 family protein [Streptantibioticus rubrisoli]